MISIIVPIYKVESEMKRCVESLINQTYKKIEIILVDDGSPDCCPQICDQYAAQDHRVHVIHKENGGLSDARNAGLLVAKGDYILYVDADDYIELDSCERFMNVIPSEGVDMVIGDAVQKGLCCGEMIHTQLQENKMYSGSECIKMSVPAGKWYAPAWLNLYSRRFLIENNLFFVKGRVHEDVEILPRIFLNAQKVIYLRYTFYNYIVRENSIMTSGKIAQSYKSNMSNYVEWKSLFDNLKDQELQSLLYGVLIKWYLKACRDAKELHPIEVPGMTGLFMIRYSLNARERLKVILFLVSKRLYYMI